MDVGSVTDSIPGGFWNRRSWWIFWSVWVCLVNFLLLVCWACYLITSHGNYRFRMKNIKKESLYFPNFIYLSDIEIRLLYVSCYWTVYYLFCVEWLFYGWNCNWLIHDFCLIGSFVILFKTICCRWGFHFNWIKFHLCKLYCEEDISVIL